MSALTPGTWRSAHDVSKVRFAVPYLGVTRITGIFREHTGALTVDDDGGISSVKLEFLASSVDLGDEYRNELVTSMDFLDVETHPWISFHSSDVTVDGDNLELIGELRLNGIVHDVQVHGRTTGFTETSRGEACLGVEATGAISRSAFGLREAQDPATRAQPDADLIRFHAEMVFMHRTT